jgi:hypothetical protein
MNVDRGDIQGAYWELKPKPPIFHPGAPTRSYYITQFTNHFLFTVPLRQSTLGVAVPCNTHREEVTLQIVYCFLHHLYTLLTTTHHNFFHIPFTLTKSNFCGEATSLFSCQSNVLLRSLQQHVSNKRDEARYSVMKT